MIEQALLDTLQVFGEVAHWTVTPASDIGDCSCPPIITWRYKQPSDKAANLFRTAVGTYQGEIAWHFSGTRRVWSLLPSRVNEYAIANNLGILEAAEKMMRMEPEFGNRANAELRLLVEHIQRQIQKNRVEGGRCQEPLSGPENLR